MFLYVPLLLFDFMLCLSLFLGPILKVFEVTKPRAAVATIALASSNNNGCDTRSASATFSAYSKMLNSSASGRIFKIKHISLLILPEALLSNFEYLYRCRDMPPLSSTQQEKQHNNIKHKINNKNSIRTKISNQQSNHHQQQPTTTEQLQKTCCSS